MNAEIKPKKKKRRWRSHTPTVCRRGELEPGGVAPTVSPVFLKQLKAFDRGLELFWNYQLNNWVLYRAVEKGGAPNDDTMMKEVVLSGPENQYRELGAWVFWDLRELSLMRYHSDPEKQMGAVCDEHERLDEQDEQDVKAKLRETQLEMHKDLGWARRGRQSIVVDQQLS